MRTVKKKEIELFKEYSHMRFQMYSAGLDKDSIKSNMIAHYGEDMAIALEQMSNARIKQKAKIRNHLDYLIFRNYECYFITLTIRDDVLKSKSASAIRKRMIRALSDFDDYIYNDDYAPETGRLHGHGIAAFDWEETGLVVPAKEYYISIGHPEIADQIKKKNQYVIKTPGILNYIENTGFVYAERISTTDKSKDKLSEYIAKLTAHSIKVKQTYVSTKKNSDYQKYCRLESKAKIKNKEQMERHDKYIPLVNTIRSSVELFKEFRELGEFCNFAVYSHLDMTEAEKEAIKKKVERREKARVLYYKRTTLSNWDDWGELVENFEKNKKN